MRKNSNAIVKNGKRTLAFGLSGLLLAGAIQPIFFLQKVQAVSTKDDEPIVLRVCNWEEYIDEGGWDEEELIDLESGAIFGEEALYDEFSAWYKEQYGKDVVVEYSCFGTNEELYNMLTLGDAYDLVCPSDYMLMKLMAEEWLVPFSDDFFDDTVENNYYIKGVSPYIQNTFEENEINGEPWSRYAAGYMWGVTGILYNPEEMSREEASHWSVINNRDFYRQITIKDNVRDTLFAAMGALKEDLFLSDAFLSDPNYHQRLMEEMNDVSPETIDAVEAYLQDVRNNVYSFETDSGKADMITGKVVANYQWSGDAVYAMDQAQEDDYYLEFVAPTECTNLWYDGWCMLKKGIAGDAEKQQVAEAFINFLSMPENAIRNMYYIGYTSVIAGGDDHSIFDYLVWNYGVDEEENAESVEEVSDDVSNDGSDEMISYSVGYFFSGDNEDPDYVLTTSKEQTRRQLYAQYPPQEVIQRSAIMQYFDAQANAYINQMWINVRCFNIKQVTPLAWVCAAAIFGMLIWLILKARKLN